MSSGDLYNKMQLDANFNRRSPKSVVFIQDYVYKALESKNIKLSDIDGFIDTDYTNRIEHNGYLENHYNNEIAIADKDGKKDMGVVGSGFYENLIASISKLDIADFVILNKMMAAYLKTGNCRSTGLSNLFNCLPYTNFFYKLEKSCEDSGSYPDENKGVEEILALYHSGDVSPESIIMNKTPVYKLVPTNHTLFIVVYSGFTNVLVEGTNNSKLRRYFVRSLMSGLFRFSSIEEAFDHPLFETFAIQFFIEPSIDSKPIDFTNYKTTA